MQTRDNKPTIYVIASQTQFNQAIAALPKVVSETFVPNFNFIQTLPTLNVGIATIDIRNKDVKNYLIILDPNYKRDLIYTLFDGIYPETSQQEINFLSDYDTDDKKPAQPEPQNTNEIFRGAFTQIRTAQAEVDADIKNARESFLQAHKDIKAKSSPLGLFSKTRITKNSSIKEMLEDALHKPSFKSSSDAKQAAISLGWLTEDNMLGDNAPPCVNEAMRKIQNEHNAKNVTWATLAPTAPASAVYRNGN